MPFVQMPDLNEELQELFESVDAGWVTGEELDRLIDQIERPADRRAAELGIELLRTLAAMRHELPGDDYRSL